jgi:hypothetical protein
VFEGGMVHGATDGSSQYGQERLVEKRERPKCGGRGRKACELGWKIKSERPRHTGRIRPERRSHGGKLGNGGKKWRGHCHL